MLSSKTDLLDESDEKICSFFQHHEPVAERVEKLLGELDASISNSSVTVNRENESVENILKILDEYQESPQLLDPHLKSLLDPAVYALKRGFVAYIAAPQPNLLNAVHNLSRVLYAFTKVRGYKTIVRFFTHEPSDLEPLLLFLKAIPGPQDAFWLWETRYVFCLWLSLVSMIPFDLTRLQSDDVPMINQLLDHLEPYLKSPSKESDAAAVVIARLLTRKDTQRELSVYLETINEKLTENIDSVFYINASLAVLCHMYKFGLRDRLLPTLERTVRICDLYTHPKAANNALLRKLSIKLTQRVAQCYLKQRVAKWRYQYKRQTTFGSCSSKQNAVANEADEDDEQHVPEQLETLIELLLQGLQDKDTIVRWSSAKGIGRICFRLPKEYAQEVIDGTIALFEENCIPEPDGLDYDVSGASHSTWHGACLALAELARRGLLLPEKLPEIMGWLVRALQFEQPRLSYAIGSHVRDAASYVAWSFARAYSPAVMAPYVHTLAPTLVTSACFDREVNVRRACAAAFQENVGRQGIFPNGIAIVTTADYFSVGNRSNAYLKVAADIAQFDEYRPHLFARLMHCIQSWDASIRRLASSALGIVASIDRLYTLEKVMPKLEGLLITKHPSYDVWHGALLSIAEVADALQLSEPELDNVLSTITANWEPSVWTNFGCEVLREGATKLFATLVRRGYRMSDAVLEPMFYIMEQALEKGPECAVKECVNIVSFGFVDEQLGIWNKHFTKWIDRVTEGSKMEPALVRCFALLLGAAPPVSTGFEACVPVLVDASLAAKTTSKDPESRQNALLALHMLLYRSFKASSIAGFDVVCQYQACEALKVGVLDGAAKQAFAATFLDKVWECIRACADDYTVDSRGDIGSIIRESSMYFGSFVCAVFGDWLGDQRVQSFVGLLLQQAAEKIDRVRKTAAICLRYIVKCPALSGKMAYGNELDQLFGGRAIDWSSPVELFPVLVPLLHCDVYRRQLLTGLVVSAGGLSESLVRCSSGEVVRFISKLEETGNYLMVEAVAGDILVLLDQFAGNDRVILPLFEFVASLFDASLLQSLPESSCEFYYKLVTTVKRQVFKTKSPRRLQFAIKIFSGVLFLPLESNVDTSGLRTKAILSCVKYMILYLVHPFPIIRRIAAEQLYLAYSTSGILEPFAKGSLDDLEDLLLETDWEKSINELVPIKETISSLFL